MATLWNLSKSSTLACRHYLLGMYIGRGWKEYSGPWWCGVFTRYVGWVCLYSVLSHLLYLSWLYQNLSCFSYLCVWCNGVHTVYAKCKQCILVLLCAHCVYYVVYANCMTLCYWHQLIVLECNSHLFGLMSKTCVILVSVHCWWGVPLV